MLPSMEELLGRHVDLTAVRKIGEGTFGEAFRASDGKFPVPTCSEFPGFSIPCNPKDMKRWPKNNK